MRVLRLCILLLTLVGCDLNDAPNTADREPLFSLLPPEKTGIHFTNTLTEGPNTNILVYEYFYNGGGVAAADFDGDGLADLYFTANMTPNRLYLNRGEMTFEDVTDRAGAAGRDGPWATGVSVVDINTDGRPDLYLSYSGMLPPAKRRNQLLVNQGPGPDGTPTFRDEAARYGLDSPAFTNQAYFVDYDLDGDLDALLLNHNPKSLPVLNAEKNRRLLATPDPERGLRLLRRDGDRFTDVTESAGINGSPLSYGLGLAIGDVNDDGLPDLYVSNDYEVPDYLYVNRGDGTFRDELGERLGQTSHFSMGSNMADIDNDGRDDILTLDMLPADNRRRKLLMADDNRSRHELNLTSGFHHQTMRNMLQLNRGDGTFAEVGRLAGIATTDWSWSALLSDFDNDGHKDLHVTNGYLRDYTNQDFIKYMEDFVADRGRLQRADVLELLKEMPASDVSNVIFRSGGHDARFREVTATWGLERPSNSNGAVSVDLDNDGDLDLVVNNINQPAFVYRNNGSSHHFLRVKLTGPLANPTGIGTRVRATTSDGIQSLAYFPNRGYLSSQASGTLHFGLGARTRVRELRVVWADGREQTLSNVAGDQTVEVNYMKAKDGDRRLTPPLGVGGPKPTVAIPSTKPSTALFAEYNDLQIPRRPTAPPRDFDRQPLLPRQYSHSGAAMVAEDLDGDGTDELLVGGVPGRPATLWRSSGNGWTQTATLAGTDRFHTDILVGDLDGDDKPDIYLGAGGYHDLAVEDTRLIDQIFLNVGGGDFTAAPAGFLPDSRVSTGAVAATMHEGERYLFVGGRIVPGRYPESPASRLLRLNKAGRYAVSAAAPGLEQLGMVTDAEWTDLDNDGSEELIVVGEWMPVIIFAWKGEKLVDATADYLRHSPRGWWNTLLVEDLNGDGRPDLLVGNEGLNRLLTASRDRPLRLSTTDVDGNGAVDPLLMTYVGENAYPEATRDELLGQLSGLRSVYTNYATYAGADARELSELLMLGDDDFLRVDTLATCLFLSGVDGRLAPAPLPVQAQYAPVHAVTAFNADGDGHTDLLLTGNELNNRQRYGRSDANGGVLLRGDGRGRFVYAAPAETGLNLGRVAVRHQVLTDNGILLLATDDGRVLQYELVAK